MKDLNQKIYVAGHQGMVGSAIVRALKKQGYANIIGRTHKEVDLTKEELKEIFDKEITEDLAHSDKILDIRESMQYSTKTSMEDEEFNKLISRTKALFDKIRKEVEK